MTYQIKKSNRINKLFKTKIDIIKLPEYTSYYSQKYKYPLMVSENLKKTINKPKINFVRAEIEDPFRKFEGLPAETQFSYEDYQIFKKFGLSPGHNAPAGHHKTTMKNWSDTFYFINMCPQDIVLNAGVWVILEQWCSYTANNNKLREFHVLTGSIPDDKITDIAGVKVNIPKFMYKIVLATDKQGSIYQACFLYPNTIIEPEGAATELKTYLVEFEKLSEMSGDVYDFKKIVDEYIKHNFKSLNKFRKTKTMKNKNKLRRRTKKRISINNEYKFLGDILKGDLHFDIKGMLVKSLENAKWFGKLINSKTLTELEANWKEYQRLNDEKKLNRTLEYHKEYYLLAKERLS